MADTTCTCLCNVITWRWTPLAAYDLPICLNVLLAVSGAVAGAGGGGDGGGRGGAAAAVLALLCCACPCRLKMLLVLDVPDGRSVRVGRLVPSLPGVLAIALEVGQGAQGRRCRGSGFIGQEVQHFCFYLLIFTFTFQLNSSTRRIFLHSTTFWTSRGHRCQPLSPPVHAVLFFAHRVQHSFLSCYGVKDAAFVLIASKVQHSHCSSIFIDCF